MSIAPTKPNEAPSGDPIIKAVAAYEAMKAALQTILHEEQLPLHLERRAEQALALAEGKS